MPPGMSTIMTRSHLPGVIPAEGELAARMIYEKSVLYPNEVKIACTQNTHLSDQKGSGADS